MCLRAAHISWLCWRLTTAQIQSRGNRKQLSEHILHIEHTHTHTSEEKVRGNVNAPPADSGSKSIWMAERVVCCQYDSTRQQLIQPVSPLLLTAEPSGTQNKQNFTSLTLVSLVCRLLHTAWPDVLDPSTLTPHWKSHRHSSCQDLRPELIYGGFVRRSDEAGRETIWRR